MDDKEPDDMATSAFAIVAAYPIGEAKGELTQAHEGFREIAELEVKPNIFSGRVLQRGTLVFILNQTV